VTLSQGCRQQAGQGRGVLQHSLFAFRLWRTVYTKPRDDLRLFTPIPRNSETWKSVYKLRSGSERSFSRKKKDYELERCRVRSLKAWYWRAHFVAMNQHLDA
jgi:hypothetical protein